MSFFAKLRIDEEWGNSYELTTAGYTALVFIMIAILLLGCYISNAKGKTKISTKQLVFSAAAMALAVVTSMLKLIDMPMGGSVTLCSMLFICLIGYFYGFKAGMLTAIAYGLLQLIIDPYIISIPQMFTDYIFAFGALGLSGIFSNKKYGLVLGYLLGVAGRFVFAFLSGMIFFGSYAAGFNMSAQAYSFLYNGAYLGLEALITVIIIMVPPVSKGIFRVKNMTAEASVKSVKSNSKA